MLFSGDDDRASETYDQVTLRAVKWSAEPEGIVELDQYGRIEGISQGSCVLTLQSLANPSAKDSKVIRVVSQREDIDTVSQRVINYTGEAAKPHYNLQKIVERYSQSEVKSAVHAPQTVKEAS